MKRIPRSWHKQVVLRVVGIVGVVIHSSLLENGLERRRYMRLCWREGTRQVAEQEITENGIDTKLKVQIKPQ